MKVIALLPSPLVVLLLLTSSQDSFAQGTTKLIPVAASSSNGASVQPPPHTVRETFSAIQVAPFEIQKDVTFPPIYLAALQSEITKRLISAKVFAEVVSAGQTPAAPNARLLRLTGLITNYKPGNRAKRYFESGLAGAAEIDSKVSFVDTATGQPLMSQDLRAVLAGGFLGGKSEDSVKDFARQVVTKAKLMLNMRVAAPDEPPPAIVGETPVPGLPSAPAHQTVIITEKDWPGSQKKLDHVSADGYRLTSLTITGTYSAEGAFLRTDAIADAFQYKLLHTVRSNNLQKDINDLAAEGFRVSPGTLVILKSYPTVIVENSSPPFKVRYEYLIKETLRVSSGEKDVKKVQVRGYTLIGETEHGTSHLLLFEKTSPIQ